RCVHVVRYASAKHFDVDLTGRQSVAERNQLRGLFRGLHTRDPRGGYDVSLRDLMVRNQLDRVALKLNLSTRNSFSLTHWLGRNIDHLRTTISADMTELSHFHHACHSERSEESLIILLSGTKD